MNKTRNGTGRWTDRKRTECVEERACLVIWIVYFLHTVLVVVEIWGGGGGGGGQQKLANSPCSLPTLISIHTFYSCNINCILPKTTLSQYSLLSSHSRSNSDIEY